MSACLLGERCRYDGGAKPCEAVVRLAEKVSAHPVCPETAGGLPIPRLPAELVGERVQHYDKKGAKSVHQLNLLKHSINERKCKEPPIWAVLITQRKPAFPDRSGCGEAFLPCQAGKQFP